MRTLNICHSNLIFSFLFARIFDIFHSILIISFLFVSASIFFTRFRFFHFFLQISTFGSPRGVAGSVFSLGDFLHPEDKNEIPCKMYKGFLKIFGKISHISRENSQKWPYLDIEFMEVATRK